MTEKPENPPVFPQHSQMMSCKQTADGHIDTFPIGEPLLKGGMSLRDYFAAAVLQAVVLENEKRTDIEAEGTAELCYVYADVMLKARQE